MSTDPQDAPRPLPDRPNLRHLKDQAKDLVEAGAAPSITAAQFAIARRYGFPSWPKLKAHVDAFDQIGQLKAAIDAQRSGARPGAHDPATRSCTGAARLREERAAHVGRRMPRAVGAAQPGAAGHGGVDDRPTARTCTRAATGR